MKRFSIIAAVIAISLIILLVLAGPVNAFNMGLQVEKTNISQGATTTLLASVSIVGNEDLNIDRLKIIFSGKETKTCTFAVNGQKISSCDFVENIEKLSEVGGYGYNYGYNDSKSLQYRITINTDSFAVGVYKTRLEAVVAGETFGTDGQNLVVSRATGPKGQMPTFLATSYGEGNTRKQFTNGNVLDLRSGESYSIDNIDLDSHNMNVNSISNDRVVINLDGNTATLGFDSQEFSLGEDKIVMSITFANSERANMMINSEKGIQILKIGQQIMPQKADELSMFKPVWVDETGANKSSNSSGFDYAYILLIAFVLFNLILLMLILVVAIKRSRRPVRRVRRMPPVPGTGVHKSL